MTFEEYQKSSRKTAVYPDPGKNFIYPALGLAGEAGEVVNKVKKIIRDDGGTIKSERVLEIKKELGDLIWYIAQLATELNLGLDDIAKDNIEKLYSRFDRGALKGDGDNR